MKNRLLVLIGIIVLALAVPMNVTFASTTNIGKHGTMGRVLSYTYYDNGNIDVNADESHEKPFYVMVASYEGDQMVSFDMAELSAGEKETLVLSKWGETVKLFAVSKDYEPLCKAVTDWNDAVAMDTSVLEVKMNTAEELLSGDYLISEDGSDVAADKQWVTAEMKNNLQYALDYAGEWLYNEEFETQEQIDTAVIELEKAITAFQPAYGTSLVDTSELEVKMNEADQLLKGDYQISVNGSDVDPNQQWVTAKMKEDLQFALDSAQEWFYNDEFETQAQVDTMVKELKQAIDAFQPAYGITALDTSELESVMGQAEYLLSAGYQTSVDGSDVTADKQWVTAKMKNDLENAFYAAAEWFYNDEFETQEQIDATVAELEDAISAFKPAYGLL